MGMRKRVVGGRGWGWKGRDSLGERRRPKGREASDGAGEKDVLSSFLWELAVDVDDLQWAWDFCFCFEVDDLRWVWDFDVDDLQWAWDFRFCLDLKAAFGWMPDKVLQQHVICVAAACY